ncbi:MAG: hypothetical protein GX781_00860 [Clostridiales bacterium]|nr:hypothetical protein [Clostridiales bacterium]
MSCASDYRKNLLARVMRLSQAHTWQEAVKEWHIDNLTEDETLQTSCVCGKENLRYLYTIENNMTGNRLYPIGSECIKKFGREDLSEDLAVKSQLLRLLRAIQTNRLITLTSPLFSRKLLLHLYELGAFGATDDNHFAPKLDYLFMLKMFNKGLRRTVHQEKKASAIILQSIKPFLREMLREKARWQRGSGA